MGIISNPVLAAQKRILFIVAGNDDFLEFLEAQTQFLADLHKVINFLPRYWSPSPVSLKSPDAAATDQPMTKTRVLNSAGNIRVEVYPARHCFAETFVRRDWGCFGFVENVQ